jgi:SAM-dependent methyltransferase
MVHSDHVQLLRDGVSAAGPAGLQAQPPTWADLGSGTGAFTLALAELLGPAGAIYSVDKDRRALLEQERAMRSRFPAITLHILEGDFARPLDLPPLDGIVMANSLHFQRDPEPVARRVAGYLKPGARLLLVEYNADRGNFAVPYPVSFARWRELAERIGLTGTRLVGRRPSRFMGEIYSAASEKVNNKA